MNNTQKTEALYIKAVNGPCTEVTLEGRLFEAVGKLIDAQYIQPIKIRTDIMVLVDEDGLLKPDKRTRTNFWYDACYTVDGKKQNLLCPCWIVGDVVVVAYNHRTDKFESLNEEQKRFVQRYMKES